MQQAHCHALSGRVIEARASHTNWWSAMVDIQDYFEQYPAPEPSID